MKLEVNKVIVKLKWWEIAIILSIVAFIITGDISGVLELVSIIHR